MTQLNNEQIEIWASKYESSCKLPESKVPCSVTGCETLTTMFGSNLHERVVKFGSIRNLLTEFKCKNCRSKAKAEAILAKLNK